MADATFTPQTIESHLRGTDEYQQLAQHFDAVRPDAEIDPKYHDGATVKLKDDSSLKGHIDHVVGEDKAIKLEKERLGENFVADEARQAELVNRAKKAHTSAERLADHADKMGEHIEAGYKARSEEIQNALKDKTITVEQAGEHYKALDAEKEALLARRKATHETLMGHVSEVESASGEAYKGAKSELSKIAGAARDAAGKRAPIAPTVPLAEQKWAEMGKFARLKESTAQAWSHSGKLMKVARVAGVGVGAVFMGKGLGNMISGGAKQTENGEVVEGASGGRLMGLIQTTAGGAVLLASLAKGGGKHAIGR